MCCFLRWDWGTIFFATVFFLNPMLGYKIGLYRYLSVYRHEGCVIPWETVIYAMFCHSLTSWMKVLSLLWSWGMKGAPQNQGSFCTETRMDDGLHVLDCVGMYILNHKRTHIEYHIRIIITFKLNFSQKNWVPNRRVPLSYQQGWAVCSAQDQAWLSPFHLDQTNGGWASKWLLVVVELG